jgi:hypothetical protein
MIALRVLFVLTALALLAFRYGAPGTSLDVEGVLFWLALGAFAIEVGVAYSRERTSRKP